MGKLTIPSIPLTLLVHHASLSFLFHVSMIGQRSSQGIKHDISLSITSFTCFNLETPRVICAHFSLRYSSFPIFQNLMEKSHFNLKCCPSKFQQSTSNEMQSKQPFHGLGKLRVNQHLSFQMIVLLTSSLNIGHILFCTLKQTS